MNRVFEIGAPFPIPDGTLVSPFLNPRDSKGSLQFDLFDAFSIAAGIIAPGTQSRIHLMSHVTQATFVRRGTLEVWMKGPRDDAPYKIEVQPDQAVLTEPGTFFQMVNHGKVPSEVLYIVSPAYLYEVVDDTVIYDDALVLEEDWTALSAGGSLLSLHVPPRTARDAAIQRLSQRNPLSPGNEGESEFCNKFWWQH